MEDLYKYSFNLWYQTDYPGDLETFQTFFNEFKNSNWIESGPVPHKVEVSQQARYRFFHTGSFEELERVALILKRKYRDSCIFPDFIGVRAHDTGDEYYNILKLRNKNLPDREARLAIKLLSMDYSID